MTPIQKWLKDNNIKTIYITPGSPWENPYIESFNSRFRDELLNRELFMSLEEARVLIEDWRREYLQERPHSSLGYLTPEEFATQCIEASSDSTPGGPVPQTPWDFSHSSLLAGLRRKGSLSAPHSCRLSTDHGAQVASPQSLILRTSNSNFNNSNQEIKLVHSGQEN